MKIFFKVKALKGDEPICHPNWIVESLKAQKLLDFRNFLLYSSESKTQPKLKFQSMGQNANKPEAATSVSTSSAAPALDASDARFLGEFYSNSRLHHISTMGANFKKYVAELREKSDGFFPGRSSLKEWCAGRKTEGGFQPIAEEKTLIMHIDMDCFFVSVGLRKYDNTYIRYYTSIV